MQVLTLQNTEKKSLIEQISPALSATEIKTPASLRKPVKYFNFNSGDNSGEEDQGKDGGSLMRDDNSSGKNILLGQRYDNQQISAANLQHSLHSTLGSQIIRNASSKRNI